MINPQQLLMGLLVREDFRVFYALEMLICRSLEDLDNYVYSLILCQYLDHI